MRPVIKKRPGEIVDYKDSRGRVIRHEIQSDYTPYGEAKMPLIGNFGRYCSYCEGCREVDALEVEHRVAKHRGGSETAWDNFLLCCKLCNTVKASRGIVGHFHWPHLNNTFLDFVYDETGRVKINPDLPEESRIGAKNLYDLVYLGRDDEDATPMDFRWQRRFEAWKKATKARSRYESGKWTADDVIESAKNGNWSIWFTVFKGVDAILSRLISDFEGTCASCFDADNHFVPIYRNPDNIDDPV